MSTEESQVMARLRAASRRTPPQEIASALDELPTTTPARLPHSDPLTAFFLNVLRNGGSADTAEDRSAAVKAMSDFIAARHPHRRLVAGHDPRLAALPWRDGGLLPRFGTAIDGDRIGVSYAQAAASETGSVIIRLDRNNPALNNLLPDDHIALVDLADVHPYLEAAWERGVPAGQGALPRGLIMISGPSSTADIAKKLVRGAHGPRAFHVIVVGVPADSTALDDAKSMG